MVRYWRDISSMPSSVLAVENQPRMHELMRSLKGSGRPIVESENLLRSKESRNIQDQIGASVPGESVNLALRTCRDNRHV